MMIETSTALRNDHDPIERRKELLKLRAKLAVAEESRLSGQPAISVEESRRRLEAIYRQ